MPKTPGKMVYEWFRYANDDLITARALYELDNLRTWRSITFHCQQVAEKALKGLLAYNQIKFSKTHDLAFLAKLLVEKYPKMAGLLEDVGRLTQYAVEFRYPDAVQDPLTKEKLAWCLRLAEQVFGEAARSVPFESGFGEL